MENKVLEDLREDIRDLVKKFAKESIKKMSSLQVKQLFLLLVSCWEARNYLIWLTHLLMVG